MPQGRKSQILINYPFIGKIRHIPDAEHGVVGTNQGNKLIHIDDCEGQKLSSMDGLKGQTCVFIIGGDPKRFLNEEEGWHRSILRWRVINHDSLPMTQDSYRNARDRALLNLDDTSLRKLLASDWYVQKWHRSKDSFPESVLQKDYILSNALERRLSMATSLEQLVFILIEICNSPWFVASGIDPQNIYEQFFKPEDWPPSVFLAKNTPNENRLYRQLVTQYGFSIKEWVRKSRAIAIDIEGNSKTIYEIGWKSSHGTGYQKNANGVNPNTLQSEIDKAVSSVMSPCIVGHNLIGWDWPIIQGHRVKFPKDVERWDTLLGSWLLDPWVESHALIVKNDAHSANKDAIACYELYRLQSEYFDACFSGASLDIESFVDHLFEDPSLLSLIDEREYPKKLQRTLPGQTLFPKCEEWAYVWQQGCFVELVNQANLRTDPVLLPEICRAIAISEGSLAAKALAVIVSDASRRGVSVHLSWIPSWLTRESQLDALRDAHARAGASVCPERSTSIFIAEDLFQLSDEELYEKIDPAQLALRSPEHIATVWLEARREALRDREVSALFPTANPGRTGRALVAVEGQHGPAWLMYILADLHDESNSWFLLPAVPDWIRLGLDDEVAVSDLPVRVPRWREGSAGRLDVDRLFISPDTANRRLYLAELTHCVLNLLQALEDHKVLVVGVRGSGEAQALQQNLVHLELSSGHPGTRLRHLESVYNKGHRVLCCAITEIPHFLHAAELLDLDVEIVIDELPVYEWHAILNPPSDGDQKSVPGEEGSSCHTRRTTLRVSEIRAVIATFLWGWLEGLGLSLEARGKTCLLLDERVSNRRVAAALGLEWRDVPFYPLDALLDRSTREVFDTICYPRQKQHDIPNDYRSYQDFLRESWGYDDFRPGTQRPAIKRIIESSKDLLLRLPTGAGKSIIFHLPALLRSSYSGRLSLVITPLRALMQDQAEGLWRRGFTESVDFLSGGREPWLNHEVYQGLLDGRIRLLFIAPERLRVPRFVEALERRRQMDGGLEFIVFDEAHCVSEWGFEFRPDYLYAARFIQKQFKERDRSGNPHRLLLTSATVTQRNRADLERELGLGRSGEYDDLPEEMPHPIQPFIEIDAFDLHEDPRAPSDDKLEKTCEILSRLDLHKSAALLFARTRKDCHRLSEALNARAATPDSELKSLRALPFHAGLSESLKTEALELLRARSANLLVCTKAFGMGMDIPHLHACVHHRPPTFIEDYLQEVGRIGRDAKERISSGHEHVTASLLYNPENIEHNISMIYDKAVQPPDLADFFAFCVNSGVLFEEVDKSICIVPAKVRLTDAKEFDENQVTNSLFWLERMEVLEIAGRHPPSLGFNLTLSKLRQHASGGDLSARIASTLLEIVSESRGAAAGLTRAAAERDTQPESIFERVVRGLVRGVLALVSQPRATTPDRKHPEPAQAAHDEDPEEDSLDIDLSMRELMARCGDLGADDLFAGIFELSKAGALRLEKILTITKPSTPSEPEFFGLLQRAVDRLTRSTHGGVERLDRERFATELERGYRAQLPETSEHTQALDWRIKREVYRAVRTSIRILRQAGFELQEEISKTGLVGYARSLSDARAAMAERATHEVLERVRLLVEVIRDIEREQNQQKELNAPLSVPLTTMMGRLGGAMRVSALQDTMKLVESGGFFQFESDMDAWVSIVTLKRRAPLPPHEVEKSSNCMIQHVYTEMLGRFELQILRAQSMALLVAMPPESRKRFIDDYFECTKAEELSRLLEDTVGGVEEEVVQNNPMLRDFLSRVRQERFTEEIEKLDEKQLAVCKASFDRYLLVNAGPGSGKTHVLMMRCAHLIHSQRIAPASILVLAFNRSVVYEIRDRIQKLFHELGYGSYVKHLDVTTFHSFALRFQKPDDSYEEDSIGDAVHLFAKMMKSESEFARSIGGRYKSILIDEFQDMNEDFFDVVESLMLNCSGGGMVIGDDDQDILAWNRVKWRQRYDRDCPMQAVHYFGEFIQSLKPEVIDFNRNYRSAQGIVERTSRMIHKAASNIDFQRMKRAIQQTATRHQRGAVRDMNFLDSEECRKWVADLLHRGDHVAILCRSNRECRDVYNLLILERYIPRELIEILGSQDFSLYQLRAPGALLDICRKRDDYDFIEYHCWEEMLIEFEQLGFADTKSNLEYLNIIYKLVREESGRPRVRDLKKFIMEMRSSDVERLRAKIGLGDQKARLTITTIHKVKGLEYDSVIILPSRENFPFPGSDPLDPIKHASAEEARLYYVAMTRARNQLCLGWGDRERAWWSREAFRIEENTAHYRLKGSPEEVWISLPGQSNSVNEGWQDYIAREVSTLDLLTRHGRKFQHRDRPIGVISKRTFNHLEQAGIIPQLKVSNVIRYSCGEHFRNYNPDWWEKLHTSIQKQGWFYVVLIEEA